MDMNDQKTPAASDASSYLANPHLVSLETYWKTLRHARRVPARSDLNPALIDQALPFSFILQRVAPGTARFRVAGQQIHALMKMDARGMPLTSLFQPETRDPLRELIEKAFQAPAIIGLPLLSQGGLLRSTISGAMLLLPMQDTQGHTNRLLGALVFDEMTLPRPRRFAIDPAQSIRCETLGPTLAASQLIPKDPVKQKGPHVSQHTALRLVVNNG
ncbi:PAS domain-containing protein [Yoonia sp.]|uniref:PAS domain-containing protein n=1 Tax=Yoonia sp. TaxID=2212373 RepID=UPI0023B6CFED